ncbi:MAG: SGNH/GDSL hydrolase family protein [Clostridia bacterium]|nr:SGNH/GDSL hydrolase family protein [Clostridia bacterium]
MKRKWKIALGSVCIVLVTAMLLGFVQALVVPKYMTSSLEGNLVSEYYGETTPHDVLFVGDCEVYECFTPATLWEKYGITSYIRGSAQQLAWHSYYLLEESLEIETPKMVVFNVLALKYGKPQSEAYNRMTLDGMKWSSSKIDAIKASMTEDESFLSYVFPLLRFHSRWSEIGGEDFEYLFHRDTVSHNGYLMQTDTVPMTEEIAPSPLLNRNLPATSMDYLEKMRFLCEEKGVEFVLIKAPTNSWRYYWYDEWDEQIVNYAESKGLDYYNFIPLCEEIGIDWTTDTYDAGAHLNVYGAEKLTAYFGKILSEKYGIADQRGDATLSAVWADKVNAYYAEKNQKKG